MAVQRSFAGHHPQTDSALWLAPDCVLVGNVRLGADSSVFFTTVLRADSDAIRIGARTNLQDGVVVHVDAGDPVEVGDDVSVGHRAVLHGCRVGDGSLIGMSATVMSGAVIGSGCLVAAGAVVTPGKQFRDGVLIAGVPAREVRDLTEQEQADLRRNAAHYCELAAEHRRQDPAG